MQSKAWLLDVNKAAVTVFAGGKHMPSLATLPYDFAHQKVEGTSSLLRFSLPLPSQGP